MFMLLVRKYSPFKTITRSLLRVRNCIKDHACLMLLPAMNCKSFPYTNAHKLPASFHEVSGQSTCQSSQLTTGGAFHAGRPSPEKAGMETLMQPQAISFSTNLKLFRLARHLHSSFGSLLRNVSFGEEAINTGRVQDCSLSKAPCQVNAHPTHVLAQAMLHIQSLRMQPGAPYRK